MNIVLCLTDTSLLAMTDHVVQRALSLEGFNDFRSRWVLVVTWHNVLLYYPTSWRQTVRVQS